MKRKWLFFALMLIPMWVSAYDAQIGGIYYNLNQENNTAMVTYYHNGTINGNAPNSNAYWGAVEIPSEVTYNNVVYSVTGIGFCAFNYCKSLTSITIPNSVTFIDGMAFYYCTSLTTINIPNSVNRIGAAAFDDTPWYKNQPDGLVYAGKVAYKYKGTMPSKTSITIKDGTLGIAGNAFRSCSNLVSISIPNSVMTIVSNAFYECTGLTTFSFPESMTSIDGYVLQDCSGLTSISIPETVTAIGDWTFSGCSSLTSITIPRNVTSIGAGVFASCNHLIRVVTESNTPPAIKENTFPRRAYTTLCVPTGCKTTYEAADYWKEFKVIYDEIVEVVPSYIDFADASVKKLCVNKWDTDQDQELSVEEAAAVNESFGITFQNQKYITSFDELRYFTNVTRLDGLSFYNCTQLTNITLPQSLLSIESNAFSGCIRLTDINIPQKVSSIGYNAFLNCNHLTTVSIPKSVTDLGNRAFEGCNNLTTVIVGWDTPLAISEDVFPNRTNATLYVPAGSKDAYLAANYWKEFKEIVEEEAISDGNIVFADAKVKSICVANWDSDGDGELSEKEAASVTYLGTVFKGSEITSFNELRYFKKLLSIDAYAFRDCSSLASVILPNSIMRIGGRAFSDCTSLSTITIPDGINIMGGSVFYNTAWYNSQPANQVAYIGKIAYAYKGDMPSGTELTLKEGTKVVAPNAFASYYGLKNITLPNSVTSVCEWAFFDCWNMKTVSLGMGVTYIGPHAFSNCGNLTMVNARMSTPVDIANDDVFYSSIFSKATLHVFKGCKSAYQAADVWKNFGTITDDITSFAIHYPFGELSFDIIDDAEKTCEVLGYDLTGEVNIPSSVYGYQVVGFGVDAFEDEEDFESLVVPPTITFAAKNAFKHIGNIIVKISDLEAWCKIDFRDYPGGQLYLNGESLTNLVIPDNITEIKPYAFPYFRNISTVTIPEGVTSVGYFAFYSCDNLTSVTVKRNIPAEIDQYAFSNQANITLYVPTGCKAAYEAATGWKDFKEIVEYAAPADGIQFADAKVKALCVANWDTNGDGELSEDEAAAVTDLGNVFNGNHEITSFNELQYFWGLQCNDQDLSGNTYSGIPYFAFSGCTNLKQVTLPNVEAIGHAAFSGSGLTAITIPSSVRIIVDEAFYNTNISEFVLPASVTDLCDSYDVAGIISSPNLKSIVVESGNPVYDSRNNCNAIVRTASNQLINGCFTTTIPGTVTSIRQYAFMGCQGLTAITIPISVTSIGGYAFEGCNNLTSVTVENPMPFTIGNGAFSNCANATLHVPAGSKAAYKDAVGWKDFKEIVEPVVPGSAEDPFTCAEAIAFVSGLSADTPTETEYYVKGKVSKMQYNYSYQYGNATFWISDDGTDNGSFYVYRTLYFDKEKYNGGRVPNIGDEVVLCGQMVNYKGTTPETYVNQCRLVSLNDKTVGTGLEVGDLFVAKTPEDVEMFFVVDNTGKSLGKSTVTGCSVGYAVGNRPETYTNAPACIDSNYEGTITIPETAEGLPVQAVAPSAFVGAKLTAVTMPATIWDIETNAFSGCTNLASVKMPEDVILNNGTFKNCTSLTSVELPKGVQLWAMDVIFKDCSNLTAITVNDETPYELQGNYLVDDPSKVTLYVPAGSKAAYEAATGWKDFKEIVEGEAPSPTIAFADAKVKALCVANWDTNKDSELSEAEAAAVTDLGEVFKENSEITSFDEFEYFSGVTELSAWMAFEGCTALKSIIIPAGVTRIDGAAFANCAALETISIDAMNSIYESPAGCNAVIEKTSNKIVVGCANTVIPNTVTTIGDASFWGRWGMASIDIPESVTVIEQYAFTWSNMSEFTMPSKVEIIDTEAFAYTGLKSVTLPVTLTAIGDEAFNGCNDLVEVTVENPTPVAITADVFSNRANATLYVPGGCVAAYRAADYWKEFGTIMSYGSSSLYAEDLQTLPGTTAVLAVNLDNVDEAIACKFDLRLPAGVTVVTKSNGKLDATLTERAEYHSISSSHLDNGDYSFVITSQENDLFTGNNGALVEIRLDVPLTMECGDYTVQVLNTDLTALRDNTSTNVKLDNMDSKLTVTYMPGDVNCDGSVSVTDVGCTINYILKKVPEVFVKDAADMDGDNEITVTDVTRIIAFILDDDASMAPRRSGYDPVIPHLSLQQTADGYALTMDEKDAFVGFQFDVELSAGATVNSMQLNSNSDHLLTYRRLDNGMYRVVCYSLSNSTFADDEAPLLNMSVTGDVSVSSVLLTTAGLTGLRANVSDDQSTGIASMNQGLQMSVQGRTLQIVADRDVTLRLYTTGGGVYRVLNVHSGVNTFEGLKAGVYMIENRKMIIR